MAKKTLKAMLQSTSDVLFPAEVGDAEVPINSTDGDGGAPLHVLIRRNDTASNLLLIENGAPVNAAGDMGETPLHIAISNKNMAVMHALISAGAGTDIVNEFSQTALERAIEEGITLFGTS